MRRKKKDEPIPQFKSPMDNIENKRLMSLSQRPPRTSDIILGLLRERPTLSAGAVAKIVGISRKCVEKHFARLKRYGMLRRIGPDKGGHWEIVEIADKP